jgi:predicted outer membrane lipoprotein
MPARETTHKIGISVRRFEWILGLTLVQTAHDILAAMACDLFQKRTGCWPVFFNYFGLELHVQRAYQIKGG